MPAMPNPKDLSEIALFHGLTSEQLSWLSEHLNRKTFPAGSNIVLIDQPGEIVYIILKGTIKIFVDKKDGTEMILAILGPGDTVGELSLLDSAGRSANVVTMEKSTLLWMDRTTFWQVLRTMPAITYKLTELLSGRLRLANEQITALAELDVFGRVARQILAIAEQYGRPTAAGDIMIPIRLTQSDIAGLIGASRERVNQIIVAYKQENYISVDDNYRITVHNKEALAKRCL
jgi:CRP/FNR family cyclic AMP-dependent transcriptional regulator